MKLTEAEEAALLAYVREAGNDVSAIVITVAPTGIGPNLVVCTAVPEKRKRKRGEKQKWRQGPKRTVRDITDYSSW